MTVLGRKRRRIARALLVDGVLLIVLPALLFISAPPTIGGMHRTSLLVDIVSFLVIGGGVAGMLFGLVWMIRIYRSDPEAHESSFRYRDF